MNTVIDRFSGPDGRHLTEHTPDRGPAWVETSGRFELLADHAQVVSLTGGSATALIDGGSGDQTVTCTLYIPPGATGGFALLARASADGRDAISLRPSIASGSLNLGPRTANVFSTWVSTPAGIVAGVPYQLRISCSGQNIVAEIVGGPQLSWTSPFQQLGTRAGLYADTVPGKWYDDLTVNDPQPEPQVTLAPRIPGVLLMSSRNSKEVVYNAAFQKALIGAYSDSVGVGGLLTATPKVRLIQSPGLVINPNTTRADLLAVEANFSGYAAVAPTITTPVRRTPEEWALVVDAMFLGNSTTTFTPNTVVGWWIDKTTDWVAGEMFPAGQQVGFAATGDYLELTITLPEPAYRDAAP